MMTDMTNVESLVLEHLRAIRSDLGDVKDRLYHVETRLGSLEVTVAGVRRDLAHIYGDSVEQNVRYDQLNRRIERIEKRLELKEG